MSRIKPFDLSELEEVAALASGVFTDYIVYSEDPEYYQCETITRSKAGAWNALRNYKDGNVPGLHLHQVTGHTEHPLNEDPPVGEVCLNHAC